MALHGVCFSKQVVPLSLQAALAIDKGDLPTAARRSGSIRCFRIRKTFPGNLSINTETK